MNAEPLTVTHDGIEYSGPTDDIRSELGITDTPAPEKVEAKVEAKAEPAKTEEPAKPTAQETHDRIQRLTWEREEANRRAEAAEKRAADAAKPKAESKTEPSKADHARYRAMPDAPQQDHYDDVVDYATDMAVFASRKFLEEARATEAQERATQSRADSAKERHRSFHERLEKEKAEDKDFDAVLSTSEARIDDNGPMAYVIASSEIGPKILKYLALNPKESERIASIDNPHVRYGEMKVIEGLVKAQLKPSAAPPGSATVDTAAKAATKAEPPINPVGSSHVSVKDDDALSDDLSDEEYFRRRDKQDAEARRKGVRR